MKKVLIARTVSMDGSVRLKGCFRSLTTGQIGDLTSERDYRCVSFLGFNFFLSNFDRETRGQSMALIVRNRMEGHDSGADRPISVPREYIGNLLIFQNVQHMTSRGEPVPRIYLDSKSPILVAFSRHILFGIHL